MRYALAIAVLAVAWAAAVYVHQRHVTVRHTTLTICNTNVTGDFNLSLPSCSPLDTLVYGPRSQGVDTYDRAVTSSVEHPTWEDPVAVLLGIGGIAVAVGIVLTGRKSRSDVERPLSGMIDE